MQNLKETEKLTLLGAFAKLQKLLLGFPRLSIFVLFFSSSFYLSISLKPEPVG
jgi:hypothetical protein